MPNGGQDLLVDEYERLDEHPEGVRRRDSYSEEVPRDVLFGHPLLSILQEVEGADEERQTHQEHLFIVRHNQHLPQRFAI